MASYNILFIYLDSFCIISYYHKDVSPNPNNHALLNKPVNVILYMYILIYIFFLLEKKKILLSLEMIKE